MDKEKRNIQTLATTQSKYLSDILDVEDVKEFKLLIPELKDTWKKKQVFRTETEMRFSVLSDNKYPTRASKYWQCVREQNTHFENLMHLSFDARKNMSGAGSGVAALCIGGENPGGNLANTEEWTNPFETKTVGTD